MEVFDYLLGKKSSGGGGGGSNVPDWTQLGYTNTPQQIINDFNYSKTIIDNWDNTITDLTLKFNSDKKLVYMPLVDTSNVTNFNNTFSSCEYLVEVPLLDTSNTTNMGYIFNGCTNLKSIPLFDTSNVTTMQSAFYGCKSLIEIPILNTSKVKGTSSFQNTFSSCIKLSNESLDNILQMCINATSYSSTKTLARLGFNSTNYPTSRIESLPHYQAFISAGWTIGY